MSTGAVFKLIANDGKADRMIMATMLLQQRIRDIMCARQAEGKQDTTPTLMDLERTHVLFVNAHFKPYAAIGFEYNKVRAASGQATLGSSVQFSIPQFGDFFHDMVCRVRLGRVTPNVGVTPLQGTAAFPFNVVGTSYNLVDMSGDVLVAGVASDPNPAVSYYNMLRYCEYPGTRLFKKVKFEVNGNPLDEYDSFVPTMLEKFCVLPNKRIGHDRLLGQEVPHIGYGSLLQSSVVDADAANTPPGITRNDQDQSNQTVALFNGTGSLAQAGAQALITLNQIAPPNQVEVARELKQIVNGPQTPKPFQPPLEIMSKLRFWYNDDVRLSVPSVSIPYGQRFITIELEQQDRLVSEVPGLYLQTIQIVGATNIVSYSPVIQYNGYSDIAVERMELYINNIFVNPEVHDIYIKRIGFSLIRVYREQVSPNVTGTNEMLLSNIKWPVEYMMVGLRPRYNTLKASAANPTGNRNEWRDWHRLTRQVTATPQGQFDLAYAAGVLSSQVGRVTSDEYYLPVSTVNSLSLTSHGINIYDSFSDLFFNQYMPYHYGQDTITTPADTGALFVNMSLFPRDYQPSGHLNVSRARETYLKWTSSYQSAQTPLDLVVVAVAINFLLITDGSAVLRYST